MRLSFTLRGNPQKPMDSLFNPSQEREGEVSIHLRSKIDPTCYACSFVDFPESPTFEKGGAYPGGAESDSPDFCGHCEQPVGNPLTSEGESLVREWVADLPFRLDPTGTLAARMEELKSEYSYLFS
jgi:hypothetical protein